MTATSQKDRCENENEEGRLCAYGPGHACECRFKPIDLTDAMYDLLDEAGRFPTRKFQNIGTTTTGTLKALSRRGLIHLRYVNSRAWDATITPAGRRVLTDRPR